MLTPVITPSASSPASPKTRLVVVVQDDRAIVALLEQLFDRSGLTQTELASRMGVKRQTINQYLRYKRRNPTIRWVQRFAEACGGRVIVELPS